MNVLTIIYFAIVIGNICSISENCFENICFFKFNDQKNYLNASDECKILNLTLTYVPNKLAQGVLKTFLNLSSGTFYIGLKYIPNQRFIWESNNDEIPDLNWVNGSRVEQESCAYISAHDGLINVSSCSENRGYVCSNFSLPGESLVSNILNKEKLCPEKFFRFMDKCYQMNLYCNDKMRTWNESQKYCKSLSTKSNLMIVNSMIDQEFLTALMIISPQALWIGLHHLNIHQNYSIWTTLNNRMPNYPINFKLNEPNNVQNEKCLMVYHRISDIGKVNDENCSRYLNYLCESPLLEESTKKTYSQAPNPLFYQGKCKINYLEFNETCYRVFNKPENFLTAKSNCNGQLAFVYSFIDAAFIRSLMAFTNISSAWISALNITLSASKGDASGLWISNEKNEKAKIQLNSKSCIYITTNTKGLLSASSCSETKPYLCYYFLDDHEEKTDDLKCPLKWQKVGKKCYQKKSNIYNFTSAANYCKLCNGNLATIKNLKEEQKVLSLTSSDTWIGLNGKSFLNQTWIDGTKLDYCRFRHTKSMFDVISKKPESCFYLNPKKAEWEAEDCGMFNNFVCEQPAKKFNCPDKFNFNIDGDCYGKFDNPMTWYDAEAFCQTVGGNRSHLASFHSPDQENFFFEELKDPNAFWIGLHFENSLKSWSDGSPVNYVKYLDLHPDSVIYSCFSDHMDSKTQKRKWKIENCGIKRSFICKYSEKSVIKPLPKKPNFANKIYCPEGFTKHGLYCFKFVNESTTWEDADVYCRKLTKGYPTCRLARFDRSSDFDSVISSLRHMYDTPVWIGLYDDDSTKQLVWIDERPFQQIKPIYNTSKSPENKVAFDISSNPYVNGRWAMYPSLKNFPFLCRVNPHEKYNSSSDSNITQSFTSLRRANCSQSFVSYNGNCYFYNKDQLNFMDAEKFCKGLKSSLAVIEDTFEEYFVRSLFKFNDAQRIAWVGLKVDNENNLQNWSTINNASIFYTHWQNLDVFRDKYADHSLQFIVKGCYVLHLNDNADSGMSPLSCSVKYPSICKSNFSTLGSKKDSDSLCATSKNGTMYYLDVVQAEDKTPCVRWDLVSQKDPFTFHAGTQFYSSFPFNKNGYLSYSLDRCSEFKRNDENAIVEEYSCYTYEEKKFNRKKCQMISCQDVLNRKLPSSGHPVVVTVFILVVLVSVMVLIYIFRKDVLSTYRVRVILANVLGRYQPDWLRDSHARSRLGETAGTGFANPIYTPLETRY